MDVWTQSHNGFQIWNGLGANLNNSETVVGKISLNGVKALGYGVGEISWPWLTENKCEKVADDVEKYYNRALDAREKYQKENVGKKND